MEVGKHDGQARLLILRSNEDLSSTVFRLQRGWRLSFACDPVLQSHSVRLFCNHPLKPGGSCSYRELAWVTNSNSADGYDSISQPMSVVQAGSFHFYYTTSGSTAAENACGNGYFIVDPELHLKGSNSVFNMDSIQVQTVLPKLLGALPDWRKRLMVSAKSGYNMIHFTPLQKLNSESNSSYSISDQLQINPAFSSDDATYTMEDISVLVTYMEKQWKCFSMTDMVYNHTANDSVWLVDHPDSAYNLSNSPHLKPAFLVDRAIVYLSRNIAAGNLSTYGLPGVVDSERHLELIGEQLHLSMNKLKLEEFFTADVKRIVQKFQITLKELLRGMQYYHTQQNAPVSVTSPNLPLVQDDQYNRLASDVDTKAAVKQYLPYIRQSKNDNFDESQILSEISSNLTAHLEHLNQTQTQILKGHIEVAINNVLSGIRYRFLSADGPRIGQVTIDSPLVHEYFIYKGKDAGPLSRDIQFDSDLLEKTSTCKLVMVHNGWVMGDDPLKNFAESGSLVYLRRKLIAWGDSIKLRYGSAPADSPALWKRMEEYTRQTASVFHAIRLDNCHSTPIHVAEYMIRLARSIRPDLYVVAELFTSHEDLDNLFVNRLGINSLIREGLQAWDAHEQGRLVYKYGGVPVGSFTQPNLLVLKPSTAHALLMDVTHDNDSVIQKRTVYDSLSLSAFVCMACAATGSNRGYDELVPHHIHVVDETRLYPSWTSGPAKDDHSLSNGSSGIIAAKNALNEIHQYTGANGYNQVYVHDLGKDVVSIVRHNPNTHKSIICVVRSAFTADGPAKPNCEPLKYEGQLDSVVLHASLVSISNGSHIKDSDHLNGLDSHALVMCRDVSFDMVAGATLRQVNEKEQEISLKKFPPGSVLIIRVNPDPNLMKTQAAILTKVSSVHKVLSGHSLDESGQAMKLMMFYISLNDMNKLLYRCEREELTSSGVGAFDVPRYGKLIYNGLQGIISPMSRIRYENDLGHPICDSLRAGDWLLDYISAHFAKYPTLIEFGEWVNSMFSDVKRLPRYLIPCYFDIVLVAVSMLVHHNIWNRMSRMVMEGSPFVKQLALSTLQFCGSVPSAKLAPVSETMTNLLTHPRTQQPDLISVSAGLPHFSEGVMRNWGRDTFIALRGLLLVTGRFDEAKSVILSYAGTLRHGLIPNLHGEGTHARYNCRDAVWWWLQSIQDYTLMAPEGSKILTAEVIRMYPTESSAAKTPETATRQPLHDVIQEALQRHAHGIDFRERNAGRGIDEHMKNQGFNVTAGINWKTGFVYGGNDANCGTWMDKMGSNQQAGNRGNPATPRNGSAVELVGLCYSTVAWLSRLNKLSVYPFTGVVGKRPEWSTPADISFDVWKNLIQQNFEKYFWVDSTYTSLESDARPDLIHKRNIYKDSVGAQPEWADYQLRPNFPVAMAVAPDLFNTDHAQLALDNVGKYLSGPLGLKTLDPEDWNYRGDYVNSDDSGDPSVASGFNYHNGPEWVWPVGYYHRACLVMARRHDQSSVFDVVKAVEKKLSFHHVAVQQSDWRSLPELTNAGGKLCADSCPAQAWSIACILDILHDIQELKQAKV